MSGRGSAPGERRGGRQKGTPNKATADIKALARKYGKDAFERIVKLSEEAEDERVQLAASQEILNRAYGRPAQAVTGEGGEGPLQVQIVRFADPA